MRIGFFNSYAIWGGGEKWHLSAAEYMANKGHEVYVLCDKYGVLRERVEKHPKLTAIPIHVTKHSYWNPFFQISLFLKLRSLKLHSLVFNAGLDVRSAALCARMSGIKNVVYRNGMPIATKEKRSAIWGFQKGLTHLVCISKENRRVLQEETPKLSKGFDIPIITNAFDFEKVPAPPKDLTKDSTQLTLSNTGRLSKQKGQKYLFEACAILKKRGYNIKLLMAGGGELEDELKALAKNLDLEQTVEFLGFQKNVYDTLYKSDIFAFTSLWEGTASSILEAQAIGLPVVCFNMSSMPEMVFHEQTGLLARPEDSEDFANQLEKFILDKELRQRIGQQSQENVKEKFNVEKLYAEWEKLLTS